MDNDSNKCRWLRKDLESFEPYIASTSSHEIKLDANENPFPLPDKIKDSLIDWLSNGQEALNRYPDTGSDELRDSLSIFWQLAPENITCGVGSDQIIDCIAKAFLETNEAILTLEPTFSMYAQSSIINKGRVISLALEEKGDTVNIDKIIKTANEKAKLLFLCTPNNPTGTSFSKDQLLTILDNVSIPVIIDEAYGEFAESTMIPFIHDYDNLIVLRTFSKAYGLAGARIGYALASKELIRAIDIVRPPFNLSTISQRLGIIALENHEVYKEMVELLKIERQTLLTALNNVPFLKATPSQANFIFIETSVDLGAFLDKHGVLIRRYPKTTVYTFRITVGTPEQNQRLIQLISRAKEDKAYE